MTKTVIFGAGGNVGRLVVREALRRGHEVTAAVRNPARHPGLRTDGARVEAGDIMEAEQVLALVKGHDNIISTATQYNPGTDSDAFYTASTRALLAAARTSSTRRLVIVGTMAILRDAAGVLLADAPFFPDETRPFIRSHALGLEILRTEGADVDWLYLSPSGNFTGGGRSGHYRVAEHGSWSDGITHSNLAVAVVDEIDRPAHHRMHLAVAN
ncbi:NAD(P)H-binding protein [Streptomyces ipomoeae]|uniref:NAD(P)-dependent oxidoreductase n=1 Tax=Streptomyces ipomoeae TaxID=103232 RepID=UPI0029A8D2B2|nr:NAD(P)H-binding protein [Streptomyces ipomoeae]MDX2822716.1 NAD(P)H-binding protein [Streptomyces ipomoeae]MDX2875402.1 NAD(P)H-binding protein [Streptomyces ipomoeae]